MPGEGSSALSIIIQLLVALLLIGLNGFFVAVEFAIVKVRQTRIKQLADEGDQRAIVTLTILEHLDEHLSATQFGITVASLLLGWIGEKAVAALLLPIFHSLGAFWTLLAVPTVVHGTATVISLALITMLHIVLGELVPKSLAVTRPEVVALACAGSLRAFYRVFYWPIHAMYGLANWLLRSLGIEPATENEMAHTNEELRMLVSASAKGGYLDETERDLLDNVFNFSERVAREVMVPRNELICLFAEEPVADSVAKALAEGHSRYPLCAADKDQVLGLILLKDLMREYSHLSDLRQIMRPLIVVPEQVSISRLLRLFQKQKGRMAVLVDEYGGTAGLVTLEDLLEELVGDIQDETDQEEPEVQQLDAATYEVDGALLVEEARDEFGWRLPEHAGVDTLGGLVTMVLGELPPEGRELKIAGFTVTVLDVAGYRVSRLRIRRCAHDEDCG